MGITFEEIMEIWKKEGLKEIPKYDPRYGDVYNYLQLPETYRRQVGMVIDAYSRLSRLERVVTEKRGISRDPSLFAKMLLERRNEKGLKQIEVSRLLGVSQRTWSYYERGEGWPVRREIIEKLAKFLERDVEEVISLIRSDKFHRRLIGS